MKELKPCPFCGGEAAIVFSGRYEHGGYIIARCQTCGAAAKGFYYRGDPIEYPLEETVGGIEAANAWNRRIGIPNLLFGFPVDDLVKIAMLLQQDGYDPKGVSKLLDDLKNTYEYCLDHIKMEFERTASRTVGRLKMDL